MSSLRYLAGLIALLFALPLSAEDLSMTLRTQQETKPGSGRYHRLTREESWRPEHTAIIVCDMWNLHGCRNAVLRGQEFAPRLNDLLAKARAEGVTIIHAPSGCMGFYADHPARKRAQATPKAADVPEGITSWCYQIPSEEMDNYPLDQSDGGVDDDPEEHAAWAAELSKISDKPRTPWTRQTELLTIDPEQDFISDKGDEVWSILSAGEIDNVILTGVHTNMCVLGRPFGLRQLAQHGKNVVLMRDMTDTMYNPKSWPFVSHFTGTDRIVSHIEKYVCPTVTSDQILGGEAFTYAKDNRPHVVIVMAEDEYETNQTLPEFASSYLGKDFRVSYVYGSETERNDIPGLDEALESADVLLLSVRRRALPPQQMEAVRSYISAGKPVIGIRTACHAFGLRGASPPTGTETWEKFDPEVFGGNYHGHHNNKITSQVSVIEEAQESPLLTGISAEPFTQQGSLYQVSPLADGTSVLMTAAIEGQPAEPVAWTFTRADGGKSFFTSLGHKTDFDNPAFQRLLLNSVYWAAGREVPEAFDLTKYEPPMKKI
ncbi:ThuA domain-containing protein [Blastopirellula marina]|uniref:Nicotinamidase n=1 Tax=Blastopirellula marina TaxID=124 RepID=A0A2S8GQ13_9BACT|nr:ThuA domain-containing protein [Blastopirellula marina]PQO46517.1 nicotinamidase [Blastopirellula marina]